MFKRTSSGLMIPDWGENIESNTTYELKGYHLKYLIQQARLEERQQMADYLRHSPLRNDLPNILYEIGRDTHAITQVALVLGRGEKLRVYLTSQRAHNTLSGAIHSLHRILGEQREYGTVIIPSSDPSIALLTQKTEKLATLVDQVEEGKSDGGQLIAWIEENADESMQRLIRDLLDKFNRGGAPEKEELAALYRLAYPLYVQHKNRFGKITKMVWNGIMQSPKDTLSDDQCAVLGLWQSKTHIQRRKQVEHVIEYHLQGS